MKKSHIHIGNHILASDLLLPLLSDKKQLLIVCDENLPKDYVKAIQKNALHAQCDILVLKSAEHNKTLATVEHLINVLLSQGHTRKTTLVALGGGVIGDITGFAAAIYQRGVSLIQIPTTLLAQVDAAIGGKTAVNHPLGKNMIGAFHQPEAVIIDIATLGSLGDRAFYCGLAEIIKSALISDAEFFYWLENNMEALVNRETPALLTAIERACQIKLSLVEKDEKEQGELRALLNLGHTFAHAIEIACDYQRLHGEAVSIGIVLAATLSATQSYLDPLAVNRIKSLLLRAKLPIQLDLSYNQLMPIMRRDKKNQANHLRFILLKEIGQAFLTDQIKENDLKKLLG